MILTTDKLKPLFAIWAEIMQTHKDQLIELDSVVGDGDLGLTMSDGFSAAYQEIKQSTETDIGRFFYQAGKKMSTAVPSTMGTLMASGLMQIGKQFKDKTQLTPLDFAELFSAYFDGVQLRGKAKLGEKTFLDGLYPAIKVLKGNNSNWQQLALQALDSVKKAVKNTTTMIAVHGRAATRGEQSRSLLDPGAYVAQLLIEGYVEYVTVMV